jgi:parvulin-like peptidyl-prolyl isomerase
MSRKDAQGRRTANQRQLARRALAAGFFWSAISAALPLCGQTARPAPTAKAAAPLAPAASGTKTAPRVATVPAAPQPQKISTVAIVNGEQLSRQQLAKECLDRYGSEILETIVNRRMIQAACTKAKIEITKKDVDAEIKRMADQFRIPVDRWIQMLEAERGISERQYREEIIWPTLALRALAADKLVITDEEMQEAFESKHGPRVRARIITVKDLDKAKEIHAKVKKNPAQFAEYAKNHSEDPNSASAHGIIPPIRKHMGEPVIEKAAFALAEGQVSDILFVNERYHILKCDRQEPAMLIAAQNLKHAQDSLRKEIEDEKLRAASVELFKKMQEEAHVVNVLNDKQLSQKQPGVAALINGEAISIAQLAEECISRHGPEVLEGEINRKILTQELKKKNKQVTQEDIDEEIARAAISMGYVTEDKQPDYERWQKALEQHDGASIELYIRDVVWPTMALKKLVSGNVEITDAEMQKGFEANYGEQAKVLAIVLNEQRQAQKVWEMARTNLNEDYFGSLAEQYSVDPISRGNNGQVPPIRKHSGQPVLEKAAFALKANELSGIIAIEDKFVILYGLGLTTPVTKDFEAVQKLLYEDLYEKKLRVSMNREFDRVKEEASFENFLTGTVQDGRKKLGPELPGAVRPASGTRPIAAPRAGSVTPAGK